MSHTHEITSRFISTVAEKTLIPLRKFNIEGSDYSDRVMKWPTVARQWDQIDPAQITVELANEDQLLNFFNKDKTTLTNSCCIGLGVRHGPAIDLDDGYIQHGSNSFGFHGRTFIGFFRPAWTVPHSAHGFWQDHNIGSQDLPNHARLYYSVDTGALVFRTTNHLSSWDNLYLDVDSLPHAIESGHWQQFSAMYTDTPTAAKAIYVDGTLVTSVGGGIIPTSDMVDSVVNLGRFFESFDISSPVGFVDLQTSGYIAHEVNCFTPEARTVIGFFRPSWTYDLNASYGQQGLWQNFDESSYFDTNSALFRENLATAAYATRGGLFFLTADYLGQQHLQSLPLSQTSHYGITSGSWVHYAFIYDGTTSSPYKKIFFTGSQYAFVVTSFIPSSYHVESVSRLGCGNVGGVNSPSTPWNGAMSNIQIYNRALTNAEVYLHFTHQSFDQSGLTAHWQFNETINDIYSAQNVGSAINFTPSYGVFSDWTAGGTTSADYRFNGLVFDARIYNRALTAEEVEAHYYGAPIDNNGLVQHFEFDGNLLDSSSAGNDGSAVKFTPVYDYWDEYVTLFAGEVERVKYRRGSVGLTLRDKLNPFTERLLGSDEEPITFTDTDYLPSDIAWIIVTSYGGMSDVQSTSNLDIDWEAFQVWAETFSADNVFAQAEFDGKKIGEALNLIAEMTFSAVYVENNRLTFARFTAASSIETVLLNDQIKGVELSLDHEEVVNEQQVYADYNTTSNAWGITVADVDSVSQQAYGIHQDVIKSENVWYVDTPSALNVAQRYVRANFEPPSRYAIAGTLVPIARQIGNTVRFEDAFLGVTSGDVWRLMSYEYDLDTGGTTLHVDRSQLVAGFRLDFSVLNGSDTLL